jgi:hypothetical protein
MLRVSGATPALASGLILPVAQVSECLGLASHRHPNLWHDGRVPEKGLKPTQQLRIDAAELRGKMEEQRATAKGMAEFARELRRVVIEMREKERA